MHKKHKYTGNNIYMKTGTFAILNETEFAYREIFKSLIQQQQQQKKLSGYSPHHKCNNWTK